MENVTVLAVAADGDADAVVIAASGGASSAAADTDDSESGLSSIVTLAAAAASSSVTTITITVTPDVGDDGGANNKVYTLLIVRDAPSSNNDLASLSISHGTGDDEITVPITPEFMADTENYFAAVANRVASVTVTAAADDDDATFTVGGEAPDDGEAAVTVTVGTQDVVIVVTAPDTTTRNYTISIERMAANNNVNLESLSVSHGTSPVVLMEEFDEDTLNYTAEVPYSVTGVTVMAEPAHKYAAVEIRDSDDNGVVELRLGVNPIQIIVTADNETTPPNGTYTVWVTRLPQSADASLSVLNLWDGATEVGDLSTTFMAGTMAYTVMAANSVESVTVAATPAEGATFMVNGSASRDVDLMVGDTVITVTVTAEDGTTMMEYMITVTRAAGMAQVTRDEVIAAIQAYLADDANALTRDQLIALISRYLAQ